ncbi:MAG: tetratricopeptide repeat protein [Bacteroidales bacterium]
MRKGILIILLFFSFGTLFSAKPSLDSLFCRLNKSKNDKEKLIVLVNIFTEMKKDGIEKRDKYSKSFLRDQIQESLTDQDNAKTIGALLEKKAFNYRVNGQYDLAFEFYDLAKEIYIKNNLEKDLGRIYNSIGTIFRRMDIFPKALKYHLKAYNIADKTKDSTVLAYSCNGLGNVYFMIKDYKNAEDYFLKALKIQELRTDLRGIAINCNNIANVYLEKKDFCSARDYMKKSLLANRKKHDTIGLAICFRGLAKIFMADTALSKRKLDSAFCFYKKALTFHKKKNDHRGIASVFVGLSKLYLNKNNLDTYKAEFYLDSASIISLKYRILTRLEKINILRCEIAKIRGEYNKAIDFFEKSILYRDSITLFPANLGVYDLIISIENKERQSVIDQLLKEKRIQKAEKRLYLLLNIVSFLVIFFIVFLLLKKRKMLRIVNNQKIDLVKTTERLKRSQQDLEDTKILFERARKVKTQFISGVSHEVRTPLNSIIGFSRLIRDSLPEEDRENKIYLNSIEESGNILLRLIVNLLGLVDLEKEVNAGISESFEVLDVVQQIESDVSFILREKQIQLKILFDSNFPDILVMNKGFFLQILYNLIILIVGKSAKKMQTVYLEIKGTYSVNTEFTPEIQFIYNEECPVFYEEENFDTKINVKKFDGLNALLLKRLGEVLKTRFYIKTIGDSKRLVQLVFPKCKTQILNKDRDRTSCKEIKLKEKIRLLLIGSCENDELKRVFISLGFLVVQTKIDDSIFRKVERFNPEAILIEEDVNLNYSEKFHRDIYLYCKEHSILFTLFTINDHFSGMSIISAFPFDLVLRDKFDSKLLFWHLQKSQKTRNFEKASRISGIERKGISFGDDSLKFKFSDKLKNCLIELQNSNSFQNYLEICSELKLESQRLNDSELIELSENLEVSCNTFDVVGMKESVDELMNYM